MLTTASAGPHPGTARLRAALVAGALLILFGVAASPARATFRVISHNDPAGDPTLISYHEEDPRGPSDFQLRDGEFMSFGPFQGPTSAQVVEPPGWELVDIQCVGSDPSAFVIDRAQGKVSMVHQMAGEDFCSFTNRRISASAGAPATGTSPAGAPGVGIAPSPPPALLPKVQLPKKAAVLGVSSKRRVAIATIRLTRRSVIAAKLLLGRRVVGQARVVEKAGAHELRVPIAASAANSLRRQGRTRVTLTLRIVVRPVTGTATQVFAPRVILRL
jgi:hypothetical protein